MKKDKKGKRTTKEKRTKINHVGQIGAVARVGRAPRSAHIEFVRGQIHSPDNDAPSTCALLAKTKFWKVRALVYFFYTNFARQLQIHSPDNDAPSSCDLQTKKNLESQGPSLFTLTINLPYNGLSRHRRTSQLVTGFFPVFFFSFFIVPPATARALQLVQQPRSRPHPAPHPRLRLRRGLAAIAAVERVHACRLRSAARGASPILN